MKYYLHDSNAFQDEKITMLFMNFGYEGLGLFYTALEKFAHQEKPINEKILKVQLRVTKKLEKCWAFMHEIGLISTKNGDTFNEKLLENAKKYQVSSEKNRERVKKWRENTSTYGKCNGARTDSERVRNADKIKKSKVNKNKVNKNNINSLSASADGLQEIDFVESILSDFQEAFFDVFHTTFDIIKSNHGKERKAIGGLLQMYKDNNPNHSSEQTREALKAVFKKCCQVEDKWLSSHVSPSFILSQWNQYKMAIQKPTQEIDWSKYGL